MSPCTIDLMCQFEQKGKKIKLISLRPKITQPDQTLIAPKKTKGINLISWKVLDQNRRKEPALSLHWLFCRLHRPPTSCCFLLLRTIVVLYSRQPFPLRHHFIIEYLNLHLHLHHTCINYTKRLVKKLNRATLTINYELILGRNLKLLTLTIM